jgi:hypothetical protein
MTTYHFTDNRLGVQYEIKAESRRAALDEYARRTGFQNWREMRESGDNGEDLEITTS